MKLSREQIIKALRCCSAGTVDQCKECPRHKIHTQTDQECMEGLARYALAIISKLTKENEEKDETIAGLIGTIKDAYGFAVRKMQDEIKGIVEFDIALTDDETAYLCERVDQIAKELLEEDTK